MSSAVAAPTLLNDYEAAFAGSKARLELSQQSLAGGLAHDGRYIKPFPIQIDRADGAHKWDVDGHELIDYAIGHGSLILGHNNPAITAAMHAQLDKGTHYSAGHEGEILWAQQVQKLIPSAELVRFTGSGTESNLLAMRLARAYTGKPSVLKFEGHFHGWSDYLIKGEKPPFEAPGAPGVPDDVMRTVAALPPDDMGAVEERLAQGDVAVILVEPSGGSWSMIPLAEGTLASLRDLATKYGAVLLFDEVITGFRWAPGGAQERFGITPDLTTMAKIVAGGMPGGAVAGKAEIMEYLLFKDEPGWNAKKVIHPGTYNANPLAAIAGYTCLTQCEDPAVQQTCDRLAATLRAGLNTVLETRGIDGACWGESSVFHLILGEKVSNRTAGDLRAPEGVAPATLKASGRAGVATPMHLAMALEGVDLFNGGGLLSTRHTDEDIAFTLKAFDNALTRLVDSGYL
ncbi:MAG: aminotransferase class III-fold pyridoxal phosphate-dependent enzyme [Thermomicrobiales bacterium]|nr:aminotransferase class III-fold pyridoxal phosphate-dependent enzyme [Thermomicrobiales bacterium]